MTMPEHNEEAEVTERVYAPATERVPKEPVPGHRTYVEHTDEGTPERQATTGPGEPSFARVERPSQTEQDWAAASYSNPAFTTPPPESGGGGPGMMAGACAVGTIAAGAAIAWLFVRRRRERNKPINRWRRQALHAAEDMRQRASEMREHVPSSDELQRPGGIGLLATLLPMAIILWQQQRRSSQKHAVVAVTDADWQGRLSALKERWSPRRLEMERVSISR